MIQNDITLMRSEQSILNYQDLLGSENKQSKEDKGFAFDAMIVRIKKQYRQLAECLGIVCRVDIHIPQKEFGLLKVEKMINALLREIMSRDTLIAMSIVSYEDNGHYSIQVNGHFQEKPWHKHEGITPSIINKAEKLGVVINAISRTNTKLSYDVYSCRGEHSTQR